MENRGGAAPKGNQQYVQLITNQSYLISWTIFGLRKRRKLKGGAEFIPALLVMFHE
nr:hypothetical protein [Bacillus inaquosorum]